MAKTEGQKQRLLALYRLLLRNTDETHRLSMQQILEALEHAGFPCERRSVYSDLAALRKSGMDIALQRGRNGGYWLASRPFELPELKLLADAVLSARFLTEKKARRLLQKLGALTSGYEAALLQRQVYAVGRARTANEQVYYNLDTIQQALRTGKRIRFSYFSYDIRKQKVYKYGGAPYIASPYGLCWDNENYYLVAWYDRRGGISNFRVDRMEHIELETRRMAPPPAGFDMADYTQRQFSMFNGREETVTLEFAESLVTAVFDRFGLCVTPHSAPRPGFFRITARVDVSPAFFGWLLQFGGQARVVSPQAVAQAWKAHAHAVDEADGEQEAGGL